MLKIFLSTVALTIYVSTVATAADGSGNINHKICKSSDPKLSAKEIECYPENNLMIIHEPHYMYEGKKAPLVEVSASKNTNTDQLKSLCTAFGAEKRAKIQDIELSSFFMYLKPAVMYHQKDYIIAKKQNSYNAPISSVQCKLYQEGYKVFIGDDGFRGCYEIDNGKRGNKTQDSKCTYGHSIVKMADNKDICFPTYLSDTDKEVPFGKSVSMERCEEKTITTRVHSSNLP